MLKLISKTVLQTFHYLLDGVVVVYLFFNFGFSEIYIILDDVVIQVEQF